MSTISPRELVLRCDLEGTVLEVLHQRLDGEQAVQGRPFAALVAPGSLARPSAFWRSSETAGWPWL
jgi:hypothetical protein